MESNLGSSGLALPKAATNTTTNSSILPPCNLGDPPSLIYAYSADLDMDVLMTCSAMGGVAMWRAVITAGGVISDGVKISAIIAAIGSGLPGTFVLRLEGQDRTFTIPKLHIHPFQDVRIISTATGSSKLVFDAGVTLAADAKLTISGTIHSLLFGGIVLATGASLTISGSVAVDTSIVGSAMYHGTNAGTVTFSGSSVTTIGAFAAWNGAVSGSLPGTVTIQPPNGGQKITISRSGSGHPSVSPDAGIRAVKSFPAAADRNRNGKPFTLYKMAPMPKGYFSYDAAGANRYKAICAAAGLRTVGSGYGSNSDNCARWGCMTVGKSGWGSSSDVDDEIRRNTGWSVDVVIHAHNTGFPYGYNDCQSAVATCWNQKAFVPICGLEN